MQTQAFLSTAAQSSETALRQAQDTVSLELSLKLHTYPNQARSRTRQVTGDWFQRSGQRDRS